MSWWQAGLVVGGGGALLGFGLFALVFIVKPAAATWLRVFRASWQSAWEGVRAGRGRAQAEEAAWAELTRPLELPPMAAMAAMDPNNWHGWTRPDWEAEGRDDDDDDDDELEEE